MTFHNIIFILEKRDYSFDNMLTFFCFWYLLCIIA